MTPLFLDRDGVINKRKVGAYVQHPSEFIFESGVLSALREFSTLFYPIIVVTNQAGVGKGLMSEADLAMVHEKMLFHIEKTGGRVDAIYYCPHKKDAACTCRKPKIGMGLQAQRDFPNLQFDKAWMVGDSASDMYFGKALGMKTVLVQGKAEEYAILKKIEVDLKVNKLLCLTKSNIEFVNMII